MQMPTARYSPPVIAMDDHRLWWHQGWRRLVKYSIGLPFRALENNRRSVNAVKSLHRVRLNCPQPRRMRNGKMERKNPDPQVETPSAVVSGA